MVTENFVPLRVHVRDQKDEFAKLAARFGQLWTPTVLEVDVDGKERFRVEGFLPPQDFAAQLALGLARTAFELGRYPEAEKRYRELVEKFGDTEAAPEAQYWAGVARYKATNDAAALGETARAFKTRYQESSWAKKASVWGG